MDENKRQKLAKIEYRIFKCCALCRYSKFPNNEWGTCSLHNYEHLKHSDAKRQLSVVKYGGCPQYIEDPAKVATLDRFNEFKGS
jgi:hypothetical protein